MLFTFNKELLNRKKSISKYCTLKEKDFVFAGDGVGLGIGVGVVRAFMI